MRGVRSIDASIHRLWPSCTSKTHHCAVTRPTIAVRTALAFRFGPRPAQIRACGTTALGSCLGFARRNAPRDMDGAHGRSGSSFSEAKHPLPRRRRALAAAPERVVPGPDDVFAEAAEPPDVRGHGVVREVAADHGLDLLPLHRHGQVASPEQLLADLPEARSAARGHRAQELALRRQRRSRADDCQPPLDRREREAA